MTQNETDRPWQADLDQLGLEAGPSVSAAIEIAAPAATVWQGLSAPGYLKRCHPFCESTMVESWPGVGSRDQITYYSGRNYRRNFVEWLDGVGYDIELGERPTPTSRVLWRITPLSQTSCRLSIEVVPFLKKDLSEERKRQYQGRLFGPDLRHYLECVVKGVDYWITTGRDVERDQFGRNPLYSS